MVSNNTTIVDASPEPRRVYFDPNLLNCPICIQPLYPPVFQCPDGHLVCKTCRIKVHNKCPSCSLRIGNVRCLAIEKIVESALKSCVYTQYGCTEKVRYYKMLEHERICNFSPILCPELGCEFIVVPKFLYAHFVDKHPSLCSPFTFNTVKYVYGVKEGSYKLLQERHEQIAFVLHRVAHPLGSFVNVSCVGPVGSDMNISFDLTARRGGKTITLSSPMEEVFPECFALPEVEKCLLIPNDFHEVTGGFKSLILELVIRKECVSKRMRIN